jgi:hypothetical protein
LSPSHSSSFVVTFSSLRCQEIQYLIQVKWEGLVARGGCLHQMHVMTWYQQRWLVRLEPKPYIFVYDDLSFLLLPGTQYLIQVQIMGWQGLVVRGGHLRQTSQIDDVQRRSSFESSPSHRSSDCQLFFGIQPVQLRLTPDMYAVCNIEPLSWYFPAKVTATS